MKTKLLSAIVTVLLFTSLSFAGEAVKDTTFKVFGNCGMCKARIEKALKIKEIKKASWNKKTKMLSISFVADAISVDSLQKLVASVGHDTEKYKADDAVYNELDSCCLYRK